MPKKFRIEFFGGPNDGEQRFEWGDPITDLLIPFPENPEELHHYALIDLGNDNMKYYYQGVVTLND